MSPFWLSFNTQVGSRSAIVLAPVQAPQWLCFGGLHCGSVSAQPPPPPFSFSTPGSWPPAQPADQWEIQAQAFYEGAAEDKRLEAVQPQAGLMVSDWA
ncbi:hypothetical protein NQZ68_013225 [Dissostichus eleginoides]|nr:hypothetical protein NQZ68_013225 [Dissostichus eleginoides]